MFPGVGWVVGAGATGGADGHDMPGYEAGGVAAGCWSAACDGDGGSDAKPSAGKASATASRERRNLVIIDGSVRRVNSGMDGTRMARDAVSSHASIGASCPLDRRSPIEARSIPAGHSSVGRHVPTAPMRAAETQANRWKMARRILRCRLARGQHDRSPGTILPVSESKSADATATPFVPLTPLPSTPSRGSQSATNSHFRSSNR